MIKPYILTLAQVKAYLALTDVNTTYDDKINLYLPIITDDLTRLNGICNQSFLIESTADSDTTTTLSNLSLSSHQWDCLYIGSVIKIDGEDNSISDYSELNKTVTLESVTTKNSTELELIIRNFPTGSKPIISQMILYKFSDGTMSTEYGKEVKSKSIGPLSVTFGTGSEVAIDSRFGYPSSLIRSLASIRKPRFI